MFKIAGLMVIVVSSTAYFCKKSICDYYTYLFLWESTRLAQILKSGNSMGKTYPAIFANTDFSAFRFFSVDTLQRAAEKQENVRILNLVHDDRKNYVQEFLLSLGKKNKRNEQEFLKNNIEYFEMQSKAYKERYDKNKKTNLVSGISVGMLIFIMII